MDLGRRLPPEIWDNVLSLLSPADRRTCLFVCRPIHDFVLRLLFTTVTLNFGAWENHQFTSQDWEIDVRQTREELADYRSAMAWEKLRHIKQCSVFGGMVRKLIVNAYAPGNGVFERSCLIEALAFLPNLRAFVWRGESPRMCADLVESLATNCPILEELSVPRYSKCLPLSALHNLRCLSLIWQDASFRSAHMHHTSWPLNPLPADPDQNFESAEEVKEAVRSVLTINAKNLRELILSGPGVWDSPMHVFSNLTHLDLIDAGGRDEHDPVSWGNLKLIFHHSTRLESLSIVNRNCTTGLLFDVFQSESSALPLLTSLKIIEYVEDSHPAWAFDISEFLRNKPHLRRLDLCIYLEWVDMLPLLSVIADLQLLEVLGIDIRGETLEDLGMLERSIPRRVSALRLDPLFYDSPMLPRWLSLIKDHLQLSFFYTTSGHEFGGHLKVDHLLTDPGSLVLVGAGGHMVYVTECRDGGARPGEWSKRRLSFRDVEDFRDKDWEWLLRHHQL
ncbi:hypothetical protein CERSUDRAFT_124336 [Gelatoporia subvermispora B]|uniref:F-box domain-containing protein n=1 Tax=Ceriporiopsis subvermispora (strain B) TaxID=914234 RepID=M2QHP9_CERS8|nr:hypothetical protein CERSUDRAFT_124336 [Gelatoporia subvermispora B]